MAGSRGGRWKLAAMGAARGRAAVVTALVLGAVVAAPSGGFCGGGDGGGGWSGYDQNNASPTGTYLSPGGNGHGYDVLDEACEDVLDPQYLARFETPMFRGVASYKGAVHLTDGSLLWSVDVREPSDPVRLSLQRLPGHPLRIAADARGGLFVAAGEAGVHLLQARDATDLAAAGATDDATAGSPRLVSTLALPAPALDVETLDGTRFVVVAAGLGGLVVVDASDLAAPTVAGQVSLPGFATAVAVEGTVAWVAACRALVAVDVSDPFAPQVIEAYGVPLGHARGVATAGGEVYVAGGEALFVYHGADPTAVIWTGFYAEPDVAGFYVNDVVARDGFAYIAAGDESVRSLDVGDLSPAAGFPAERFESPGPPGLEAPIPLPSADQQPRRTVIVWDIFREDPVAVGLVNDLLLVLGNFRWLGERTLQLMRLDGAGGMVDTGAYVQPNRMIGVSSIPGYQVIHYGDGLERVLPTGDASAVTFVLGSPVRRTETSVDAVWLLSEGGALRRWTPGRQEPELLSSPGQRGFDLAVAGDGEQVYLSDADGNRLWERAEVGGGYPWAEVHLPEATFPGSTYLLADERMLFAYEWVTGLLHLVLHDPQGIWSVPSAIRVGRCEAYDLADFFSGRSAARTRLVRWEDSLYVLCPEDESGGTSIIEVDLRKPRRAVVARRWWLPRGRTVDFAVRGDAAYLVTFDNNRYVSRLLRLVDGSVLSTQSFDGRANRLLELGGRWAVIDGDQGLRLYEVNASGVLESLGIGSLPGEENVP